MASEYALHSLERREQERYTPTYPLGGVRPLAGPDLLVDLDVESVTPLISLLAIDVLHADEARSLGFSGVAL
jgi:hypothetical protein